MKILKIAGSLLLATVVACGSGAGPESEPASKSMTEPLWSATASSYYNETAQELAVVTRGSNKQDIFRIDGGQLKLMRWTGNTWILDDPHPNPAGVASLKHVSAVLSGTRLDVFAVGSDKKIYHSSADATLDPPVLSAWVRDVPQNPTVMLSDGTKFSSLAVVALGTNLHLFWWTPSGNIGHAWYDNYVAAPGNIETGDNAALTFLRPQKPVANPPDLSAVALGNNSIHLVHPLYPSDGSAPTLAHIWFDGVSWGTQSSPNRENFAMSNPLGGELKVIYGSTVSITSKGPNNLEIFMVGSPVAGFVDWHVYHTSFNGQWDSYFDGTTWLRFEQVSHPGTAVPARICTALPWQAPAPEMDLWGMGDGHIWQAVRQPL
jgi:hypothetical protein